MTVDAFEKRCLFRIWKSRITSNWFVAGPSNKVAYAPTFRAALAIKDAWLDDIRGVRV